MDVGNLAAEFIPDLRNRVPVKPILDDGADHRAPARGLRLNPFELAELLTGAFDRVGDFLGDLLCAGPGVRRDDERLLDRELGILKPTDVPIRTTSPR